jgi:hypothetical protein
MVTAIFVGVAAAVLSYLAFVVITGGTHVTSTMYARYIGPFVEESLKSGFLIYVIKTKRVGFTVDAAIVGFAIGAGFAIVENAYFIKALGDPRVVIWIVRGFGTAIMHGGTTAIMGIMSKDFFDKSGAKKSSVFFPALFFAILIHSFYNHFLLNPIVSTLLIHFTLPLIILAVFYRSERTTRQWLGSQFDTDQELLDTINSGKVSDTHLGVFFRSVRESFSPEVVVDMLCYLRLQTELAISAKGILLMREAGFDPRPAPEVRSKLIELKHLEKSIGKTGRLAVKPLVHTGSHDLWQLHVLDKP